MKRTRKEHKNKEYGEQRSRHRHKTSYKDVYCAQYSIDNRDEINRIIRANEFLLQQDIKLTPKDFRRLYNEQGACCAATGLKLLPNRTVTPKSRQYQETSVLGIGIKQTAKNSASYQLVVYPYAYTWNQQRSAIVHTINPAYLEKYPISYPVFMHVLDEIKKSAIMKYPIVVSVAEDNFIGSINPYAMKKNQNNLYISASTEFSDNLLKNHSSDGVFRVVINSEIEITHSLYSHNDEINPRYRITVPLADPSINFIERTLQILHTNVLCGFTTLAQKFYCETT